MSDHNWVLENLESYHAGGLNSAERERLEGHLAKCPPCSKALQEIRGLDDQLEGLFAASRPEPGLEDRMIRSLRTAGSNFRLPVIGWIGLSAAAAVLLGILGAGMDYVVRDGSGIMVARGNLKPIGRALRGGEDSESLPEQSKVVSTLDSSGNMAGKDASNGEGNVDEMSSRLREEAVAKIDYDGAVAVSSDGKKLGDTRQRIAGDRGVAFSADGDRRLSGGKDGVRLWDARSGGANGNMEPGKTTFAGITDGTSNTITVQESARGSVGDKFGGGLGAGGSFGGEGGMRGDMMRRPGGGSFGGGGQMGPGGTPVAGAPPALGYHPPSRALATATPAAEAAVPEINVMGKVTVKLNDQAMQIHTYRNDAVAAPNYFRPAELAAAEAEKYKIEIGQKKLTKTEGQNQEQTKVSDPRSFLLDPQAKGKENQKPAEPAGPRKIIIRSGDIDFEVDSFDSAVATVTLLVNKIQNGFVATVNSEKLPNGKVRGSIVVRVPPEHLDSLVLDLRKELGKSGELKGQKIGSQDITKQYTDLESRLKAARAMEERLLQVIKSGKGEIKDLLAAEKELGVWRTKIEEFEGELRYYANQVALSTLTITLAEKEIRAPFAVIETERVQMAVEAEDVIKAQQQVLKAVDEAKGRVTKSELKQFAADQLRAVIHFEVAPDKAGPLRDRIEQLGRRTRLDIDRLQETEGGTGRPGEAKTRRKDTQFQLSLFNVANIAPRETVHLKLACVDAEDVYKKILTRIETAKGRVVTSNLSRQRNDQTSGLIQFEVKSADAGAVLVNLKDLGEVMRLQVTENPDTENVTRSKQGFNIELQALGMVQARETTCIQLATRDVPAGYGAIKEAVTKAKGLISVAQLNEQNKQNITAQLDFEIRRADEAAVSAAMTAAGDVFSRNVTRAADADNVVDSKVRWQVTLINQDQIQPREATTLGIEVNNVDKTTADFAELAAANKGRTVESHVARERTGRTTAKLIFKVPLSAASTLVDKFKASGTVRVEQFSKNPQVPESELAIAQLDVTLSNAPLIVPSDEGFGPDLRKGLSTSVKVLSLSLSFLLFGLLVVLPWAIVIYAIYRLVMRMRRKTGPIPTV